jgi:hypothetical protein
LQLIQVSWVVFLIDVKHDEDNSKTIFLWLFQFVLIIYFVSSQTKSVLKILNVLNLISDRH